MDIYVLKMNDVENIPTIYIQEKRNPEYNKVLFVAIFLRPVSFSKISFITKKISKVDKL